MRLAVFDIEANGLSPDKIWTLSIAYYDKSSRSWLKKNTTDYDEMITFLNDADVLIGHNIAFWDNYVIERILLNNYKDEDSYFKDIRNGVLTPKKISNKLIIDTLTLSWYLQPNRKNHGLGSYGVEYGLLKVDIESWEDLEISEYIERCNRDVEINIKLWEDQYKKLISIYGNDKDLFRFLRYIHKKIDRAAVAEHGRWKLDVEKAKNLLKFFNREIDKKLQNLKEAMPKKDIVQVVKKPVNLFSKSGGISPSGYKWLQAIKSDGYYEDENTYIIKKGVEYSNPESNPQLKEWLFSLGWQPKSFNTSILKDGSTREVPQIRIDNGDGKILCPSVKKLAEKEKAILDLEELSILTDRRNIVKRLLKNVDNLGFVKAQVGGFTNTLRFKHRVIVNLPKPKKKYGKEIRGLLTTTNGRVLCGADMSSLEDKTKQHYIYKYDPEYVEEMNTPDYDPHLDIAVRAGFLTEEQANLHKLYKKTKGREGKNFSSDRDKAKTTNYAATYGVGVKKLSKSLEISIEEADKLLSGYWDRNFAIKKVAEDSKIKVFYYDNGKLSHKTFFGKDLMYLDTDDFYTKRKKKKLLSSIVEMWLYNPVSRFYLPLRYTKDIFSTLNQSTGVFAVDIWFFNTAKKYYPITGQMHDEGIWDVKIDEKEYIEEVLKDAINKTNSQLKLNIKLDIDIQFGSNYAEIH